MTDRPITTPVRAEMQIGPSPDGSAFRTFREISTPTCAISLPKGGKPEDFWFHSILFQLPHAIIFRSRCAAQIMERGSREIALGQRQIMLMALVEGAVEGDADGKGFIFRAGDVAVFDYGRGYRSTTTDFDAIAVMSDRERLPAVFNLPEAHGAVLPAATAAAGLLHRQALALYEFAGDLSLAEAAGALDGLFATAGAALIALLAGKRAASLGGDVALIEQALQVIDDSLQTSNLTPLRVAAALGWSRSTLYRVLEPLGGVGAVVRQRRLARAAQAVVAQAQGPLSARKLAAEHGFASESHFNRAFRARFGLTPRALHDLVRRGDKLGLLTQAVRAGQAASEPWLEYLERGVTSDGRPAE